MTGIRYVSNGQTSGYGEAARGYPPALVRSGTPVTWTPMLAAVDRVLVPTEWNREPLRRGAVTTPIDVGALRAATA